MSARDVQTLVVALYRPTVLTTTWLELTPEMHDQVHDRIAAALDRLATSIHAVDVTITGPYRITMPVPAAEPAT